MNPEIRALFPGASERVYLDVSARSLVPDPVRAAIDAHLDLRQREGGTKEELWQPVEDARASFARLVNADPDEIAITKNVSEGLNLFATSLSWEPGDNVVVCPEIEHPNNIYLWYNLARIEGIEVRAVPPEEGRLTGEAVAAAADKRTRLVTFPSISFAPGFVTDAAGIVAAARSVDALTLVDAAQSVGAIDTDVRELGVDAVAVAGQKCLLSVYGAGFLYVRASVAEGVTPRQVARYGIDMDGAHETAYSDGELRYRAGARRFDLGNYNYLGMAAARASLALLEEWGVGNVERHGRTLAARLAAGMAAAGLPVVGGASCEDRAHIVTVGESGGGRHYTADDPAMNELHAFLTAGGVTHSIRSGVLRFSVGVYNDEGDIDRVLELVSEWGRAGS